MSTSGTTTTASPRPVNGPAKRSRAGTVAAGVNGGGDIDRTAPRTAYFDIENPAPERIDRKAKPARRSRRMTISESPLQDESSPKKETISVMKLIAEPEQRAAAEAAAGHGSAGLKGSGVSSPVPGSKAARIFGTTYTHGQTIRIPGNGKPERPLYGATHPSLSDPQEMQYKVPNERKDSDAKADGNGDKPSCWKGFC
ncbi:hypothetical protein MMC10_003832 [Thelotrema lepadinum]|nr:hypothetical protein [Thelotrema lepadinum]